MKQRAPSLLGIFIGDTTTQLYGDYNHAINKDHDKNNQYHLVSYGFWNVVQLGFSKLKHHLYVF